MKAPAALIVIVALFSVCHMEAQIQPGTLPPRRVPEMQKPPQLPPDVLEIPLPIASPRAVLPDSLEPLTPGEKTRLTVRNIFSPRALANRALLAGWDHLRDDPAEWGGSWDGYGTRMGDRMGSLATRNAIQLAADLAFKTEPRYDSCECLGFGARSAHAWKRAIIARKDDGGETLNFSRIAGAYGTPWVTATWAPDRLDTTQRKLMQGTNALMWRGATNMLREFWPDISRKFPFLRRR